MSTWPPSPIHHNQVSRPRGCGGDSYARHRHRMLNPHYITFLESPPIPWLWRPSYSRLKITARDSQAQAQADANDDAIMLFVHYGPNETRTERRGCRSRYLGSCIKSETVRGNRGKGNKLPAALIDCRATDSPAKIVLTTRSPHAAPDRTDGIRTRLAQLGRLESARCTGQAPGRFAVLREVAQLQVTDCQADDGRLVCDGRGRQRVNGVSSARQSVRLRTAAGLGCRGREQKRGKGSFTQLIIPN